MSDQFTVSNGVRQGAVASPTFFNVYLDNLFNILKKSGLGCKIDSYYFGFLGYADDLALLSPSRDTLQQMLNICEKYFTEHGIKISTNIILEKSKTKCLALNVPCKPATISLYGVPLPWVDSYKHLGHWIHSDEDMDHDLLKKRGEFIGKVHELRQEFGHQDPNVFMSLVFVYLSSMYGSNLWDLYSAAADKLYATWNILIKTTFNLPYATHRYISQNMISQPHIRVCLLKRFVKFFGKLKLSSKPQVVHLFNVQKSDYRSTFGKNCMLLCREMNVSRIEDIMAKNISMPIKMEERNEWRVPFLKELLSSRQSNEITGLSVAEIQSIIDYICCN